MKNEGFLKQFNCTNATLAETRPKEAWNIFFLNMGMSGFQNVLGTEK